MDSSWSARSTGALVDRSVGPVWLAEALAGGGRCHLHAAQEGSVERLCRAVAARASDGGDGEIARLEQLAGSLDADLVDEVGRRDAELGAERPSQGALTHRRLPSEGGDGTVLAKVLTDPRLEIAEHGSPRRQRGERDTELVLSSRALEVDDEIPGHFPRRVDAEVVVDQRQ